MRRLSWVVALLLALPAVAAAQSQTAVPTSSNAVWTNTGGASRHDSTDDPVGAPDEDTTYISHTVSGQRQVLGFNSVQQFTATGTITNVQITARCKYVGSSGSLRINMKNESGTISEDSDRTLTSSYADYTRTFTQNPFTGPTNWTVNEANGETSTTNRFFEMEVRTINPTTEIRCTQVYATVNYTAGGVGGGTSMLRLRGVGP